MLALGSFTSTVGCAKVGEIQSKKAFKAANARVSAAGLQEGDRLLRTDHRGRARHRRPPTRPISSSATAYDNQYKPSKKGEAANDAHADQGGRATTRRPPKRWPRRPIPADKKLGKLSLEYLVASYGADKLNDPAKAEPVVQQA